MNYGVAQTNTAYFINDINRDLPSHSALHSFFDKNQ